jgi:hypothetical protein
LRILNSKKAITTTISLKAQSGMKRRRVKIQKISKVIPMIQQ